MENVLLILDIKFIQIWINIGLFIINVMLKIIGGRLYLLLMFLGTICFIPIQINHYIHKSFDEYIERMNKSDVFFGKSYKNLELYYKNEKTMVETEKNIYKYLGKMKEKMR